MKIKLLLPVLFLLNLGAASLQAQWIDQNSNVTTRIWAIQAVDENVVWAGAENGTFLRTTDGGETWVPAVIPGAESDILGGIAAIDANTAYYAGFSFDEYRGSLYKTSDGGQTWEVQYQEDSIGLHSIAFWDASNGIFTASPDAPEKPLVFTTSDGGATWIQTPEENVPNLNPGEFPGFTDGGGNSLAVAGDRHAWFGTAYYMESDDPIRVFRSADKGQTWTAVETPLVTDGQFHGTGSLVFLDTLNGFSTSGGTGPSTTDRLTRTTDGGLTWDLVPSFQWKPLGMTSIPGTDGEIILNTFSGTFHSTNGVSEWIKTYDGHMIGITFASPTAGWACFLNGKIITFSGSTPTVEQEPDASAPVRLAPNFPNPFDQTTTLRFSLANRMPVRLEVTDLTGRIVAVPVQATLAAGDHQVEFAAGELQAGAYVCRLRAGEYTVSRKMTIMK